MPADICHSEIARSTLQKFHHYALCQALCVPLTSPIKEVTESQGEYDFETRKTIIAERLYKLLKHDDDDYTVARTLKNGKKVYSYKGGPIDKSDYVDKLYFLHNKYIDDDIVNLEKPKYDPAKACELSRKIKRDIAVSVQKRKREEKRQERR